MTSVCSVNWRKENSSSSLRNAFTDLIPARAVSTTGRGAPITTEEEECLDDVWFDQKNK